MALPHGSQAQAVGPLDRVPPWTLVVLAASSVQFGAGFAVTIFDDVGPAAACMLRLTIAAVILLAVWRPRARAYPREALLAAAAFGLVLGGMNFTYYLALDHLPLGAAVTIEFVGPLGVAVLLSQRRLDYAFAALAAFGIVLPANPGGEGALDLTGVLLALTAGLCWGAYILLSQKTGALFRRGDGLALASVVAALVPLVPGLVGGGDALLSWHVLAMGVLVALMSSVIPYSAELEALRRMPAHVFGVLMSLEPALAAFAGWLVLSQALGPRDLVAIGCVVIASIGVTRNAASAAPVEP